jgi:hypothetical protein
MEPEGSLPCSQVPVVIMSKDIPMNIQDNPAISKARKKKQRETEYMYCWR